MFMFLSLNNHKKCHVRFFSKQNAFIFTNFKSRREIYTTRGVDIYTKELYGNMSVPEPEDPRPRESREADKSGQNTYQVLEKPTPSSENKTVFYGKSRKLQAKVELKLFTIFRYIFFDIN